MGIRGKGTIVLSTNGGAADILETTSLSFSILFFIFLIRIKLKTQTVPRESNADAVSSCPQKLGRDPSDEDCFFDLLSKFQSSRMDDQRCHLDDAQNGEHGEGAGNSVGPLNEKIGQLIVMFDRHLTNGLCLHSTRHSLLFSLSDPSITTSPQTEELFDLIASSQSRRLDDQRVNVGNLPGLRITHNNLGHLVGEGDHQEPGDDFFNMLIKCQVLELVSSTPQGF